MQASLRNEISTQIIVMQSKQDTQAPALHVSALRKSFAGRPVLAGVDFSIQEGELVLLFGSNGAGKSTFLQILAGLQSADAGDIRFHDESLVQSLGYVSHASMMYEDLRLEENLRLFFRLRNLHVPEDKLELWKLDSVLHTRVCHLSQGQRVKAGIIRALYAAPRFLLLDEAGASLDGEACALLEKELSLLLEQGKIQGAIVVTHDMNIFSALPHRRIFLRQGIFHEQEAHNSEGVLCV